MVVDDSVGDVPLRRSQMTRIPIIFDDYVVYLQEYEYDIHVSSDPTTFQEDVNDSNPSSWMLAKPDEMASMFRNGT